MHTSAAAPLISHCISTSRASSTRRIQWGSHAKNLMNLIAPISSFRTLMRLSRAVEYPFCTRKDRFATKWLATQLNIRTGKPANADQPSSLIEHRVSSGNHSTDADTHLYRKTEAIMNSNGAIVMSRQTTITGMQRRRLTSIDKVEVRDHRGDGVRIPGHEIDNLPSVGPRL